MNISINNNNIYSYELLYKGKIHEITEPFEWKSLDNEEERNEKASGIFHKTSNQLTFVNETAVLLENIYNETKLNSDVVLFIKQEIGGISKIIYSNKLDFSQYRYIDYEVSIRLADGGYLEIYSAHGSKDIGIDIKTDVNEHDVDGINYKTVVLNGIDIVKKNTSRIDETSMVSMWCTEAPHFPSNTMVIRPVIDNTIPDVGGCDTNQSHSILPFLTTIETKSDEQFHAQTVSWSEYPVTSNMFYVNDTEVNIVAEIDIDLVMDLNFYKNQNGDAGKKVQFDITLQTYSIINDVYVRDNSKELILKTKIAEILSDTNPANVNLTLRKYLKTELKSKTAISISLKSLLLKYSDDDGATWIDPEPADYTGVVVTSLTQNGVHDPTLRPLSIDIQLITYNSFKTTTSKAVTLYDLLKHQLQLIGVRNFKSDILLSGGLKDKLIANGFMLRNFPLDNKDFKAIQMSVKNIIESIMSIFGLGYGIEDKNGIETFVIESKDYFYSTKVIDMTNYSCKVKSIMPDLGEFFNTLEVGYSKPDSDKLYDDKVGLDEYNTKREYSTILNKKVGKKRLISKIRADIYGIEKTRIEQFVSGEKKDTGMDNSLFIIDCKMIDNDTYTPKLWSDGLINKPKSIYNTDKAYNLELTPTRIVHNNMQYLKSSLNNGLLKLINSSGNSKLITETNTTIYNENDNIDTSKYTSSRYKAEKIELYINIDSKLYELISNNRYNIFKFNTDKGIIHGYLSSVKENRNTITIKPI